MKRYRSASGSGLVSTAQGEQGFWPSYADMMSAVALILFFLMLLSYIQNLITGTGADKRLQDKADSAVGIFHAGIQLSIRKCARPAFSKLHIGLGIQAALIPEQLHAAAALLRPLTSFNQDRPAPGTGKKKAAEKPGRACPDNQGPVRVCQT